MSSKAFPSLAVIVEGWSTSGESHFSNGNHSVVAATPVKFMEQQLPCEQRPKMKKKKTKNIQKTHLVTQISVEVMCKILFR